MRDLLVVVLEVSEDAVAAVLAEVDRPGAVLRGASTDRTADLAADVRRALTHLAAGDLGPRLLALAVGLVPGVEPADGQALLAGLGDELADGWALPPALPVVAGRTDDWQRSGAPAASRPVVAGAVLAAARAVGAHAHLPGAPGGSS